MTNGTDEQLVALAKGGDADASEELIVRYKPFVFARARSYFLLGGELDDLVSEGMIGLYKAILGYNEEKGTRFSTFAFLCISRQLKSAVKSALREKHKPLNGSLPFETLTKQIEESVNARGAQQDANPEEMLINQEEVERFRESISHRLSKFEQKVLKLYLEGYGYQEIANALGCTVKSADNALSRVRKKISDWKE